jgi:gamma-glutamyltranspeptidase / glutathione hydrolase / leukotriene-C4 hydrolase
MEQSVLMLYRVYYMLISSQSHSTVIDKDGMVVSLTTTINFVFGSQVLDPATGVIMNDQMFDFSIPGAPNAFGLWPSPYNYPQPGKRPLSSMVPTIITDPDPASPFVLALGGSGGSRIFGATFLTIANVMLFGDDISSAIEHKRVHHQLLPAYVTVEDGYPEELVDALRERGHEVEMTPFDSVESVIQGIHKVDEHIIFGEQLPPSAWSVI